MKHTGKDRLGAVFFMPCGRKSADPVILPTEGGQSDKTFHDSAKVFLPHCGCTKDKNMVL